MESARVTRNQENIITASSVTDHAWNMKNIQKLYDDEDMQSAWTLLDNA